MSVSSPTAPNNRLLVRFLVVAITLYLAWFFGYEQWLALDGRLDAVLCTQIAAASTKLLNLLGFNASLDYSLPSNNLNVVVLNGRQAVVVGPPCNGLVLYVLFGGFVVAFPGQWLRKLWYIPAGIVLIWVLNVLRVVALALNHEYSRESMDFNHHYTFTFIVYGFIFVLWMLWARNLANPNQPVGATQA